MSTKNNEISQKKKDFISKVAQAIKSKLQFQISGYGPRKSENIFYCFASPERYKGDAYMCKVQFARRMKHEFGGCQITSVSEFIRLIEEIGYCDWLSYWEKMTNSEEFLNFDDENKKMRQGDVETLCNFWNGFLFLGENESECGSQEWIESAIENGISDENSPLKKDYKVIPNKIIKSIDGLITVMGTICQNGTYLYFEPAPFLANVVCDLTDEKIFKQIAPKQVDMLLKVQREILLNLSNLDSVFKVDFEYFSAAGLCAVISKILTQSNNIEIV